MLISLIILPSFLVSLLVVAKILGISRRTAVFFIIMSMTIGLMIVSAVINVVTLIIEPLRSLIPEKAYVIMPFVIVFELTSGVYLSSRILELDYLRSLKLAVGSLSLTLILSILLYFLNSLFF